MFNYPSGICISPNGDLYVSDYSNHRIRKISNGQVTTIAGCGSEGFQDGESKNAKFYNPYGICISSNGDLYVSDSDNGRIRKISNDQVTRTFGSFSLIELLNFEPLSDMKLKHSKSGLEFGVHQCFISLRCPSLIEKDVLEQFESSECSSNSIKMFVNWLYSNHLNLKNNNGIDFTLIDLIHLHHLFLITRMESMECWMLTQFVNQVDLKFGDHFSSNIVKDLISAAIELSHLDQNGTFKSTTFLLDFMVSKLRLIPKLKFDDFNTLNSKMIPSHRDHFLFQLINKSGEPIQIPSHADVDPFSQFESLMLSAFNRIDPPIDSSVLSRSLSSSSNSETLSKNMKGLEPDFVIECSDGNYLKCHKWILCGRWPYMKSLINSGLKESEESRMILGDWNYDLLKKFMIYIYLDDSSCFDREEENIFIMKHGLNYGLLDIEGNPVSGFESLIRQCETILRSSITLGNFISI